MNISGPCLFYSPHPWWYLNYPTLVFISYYPYDNPQDSKWGLPGLTSLTSFPTYNSCLPLLQTDWLSYCSSAHSYAFCLENFSLS
jgi:hypothetical protein